MHSSNNFLTYQEVYNDFDYYFLILGDFLKSFCDFYWLADNFQQMVGYPTKRLKNYLASFLDDLKTYYWNYRKNFDGLFWSVLYSRIRNIRHLSSFIFFASESQALLSPINELLPCPLSPVYSKPGQPPVFFRIPISPPLIHFPPPMDSTVLQLLNHLKVLWHLSIRLFVIAFSGLTFL